MLKPITTIRCKKCNQLIQGFWGSHLCPKINKNPVWKTKVNTSRGQVERRDIRLKFMENNPQLFKKKKIIK